MKTPSIVSLYRRAGGAVAILLGVLLAQAPAAEREGGREPFSIPDSDAPEMQWWRDSMKTHEERIAWWREARFGMFVHWGVYAALGNEYQGRRGGGYAEHIQRVLKIPIPEYRTNVAGIFNPTNFNADEWIGTAKEAGMGYFVITAKHHDGFAMWPSRVNDYNITNCTPFKRDPMGELREACRRQGVKFGFYYSHAFDWGSEDGPGNDWDYDHPGGDKLIGGRNWWETRPEFLPQARKYVDQKSIPQLLELIKLYDPDIFWFDTPSKLPDSENLRIMKTVRAASPRVVINGRLARGLGDYASTADRPAEFAPHDGDWEGIPTTNESYGWNKFDVSHKPAGHFIQLLAKAAARGGNLLMNVGPIGDGRIDPRDVEILRGIGAWWRLNGDSIRGTARTPLAVQVWGESTRKGNTLYLHVFQWPAHGRLTVGGLKSEVKRARLLSASRAAPLRVARLNPTDLTIMGLPTRAPDRDDTVLALECEGDIAADPTRLLQPAFATDTLRVFDGQLHGRGLRFGAGKTRDAYAYDWNRNDQFLTWTARLNEAATFEVAISYDAEPGSEGGTFVVSCGDQTLKGTVKTGVLQTAALGRISLKPGSVEIKLTALEIKGSELMRPRSLILKSVAR